MAIQDQLGNVAGSMFTGTLALTFWVLVALFIFGLGFGGIYYFFVYRKNFDIFVKVISDRANDPSVYFDYAAVLNDRKDKTKYLRLWGLGYDLELPAFNIFEKTNKGDYIELYRKSEDMFHFLTPAKIDKVTYVGKDGRKHPFATTKQKQIENDIYWILSRKQKNKALISPEGMLSILLQNAPNIIAIAVSFLAIWVILEHLPTLLDAVTKAAEALAQASSATVVEGS